MSEHEHLYLDGGITFRDGDHALPGTGATRRCYYRRYYCQMCLDERFVDLRVEDQCSYYDVLYGAVPGGPKR